MKANRSCVVLLISSLLVLSACEEAVEEVVDATGPAVEISRDSVDPARVEQLGRNSVYALKGKIYTGVPDMPIAHIVTYKDGYILGVYGEGTSTTSIHKELKAQNPETVLITHILNDAAAYPGFVDGHAHLIGIGQRELTLNLEGTASVADLQARVAAEVATTPVGATIYGRGWIETGWPEGRFPTRDDLDQVAPDNPVILGRADGHAAVVNSLALEKAGITDETPNPKGGIIDRDETGRATGILIDTAEFLVAGLLTEPTREERRAALKKGAEVYAGYGWTGLHNMSVTPVDAELIANLEEAGELPVRVYNALTPEGLDGLIETGIWDMNDGKVTTRSVKYYIDGALGSRGAALHEPYSDQPDTSGLLLITEERAKAAWTRALENGIQITTHAIGDRGNTLVLDWYEDVLAGVEGDPKWRIEHAQIIAPADIPRFAELGVIASMQPSHAIGDLHFAPYRLGPNRLEGAYAWRSLTDTGALLVGGSDAPVERGDPMIEFYATVVRKDLQGFSDENWRRQEKLTREEALTIFTLNPAIASFNEDRMGSIEIGKKADITVLSADIMTIPEEEIPQVKAVMTIVDGKVVYDGRK